MGGNAPVMRRLVALAALALAGAASPAPLRAQKPDRDALRLDSLLAAPRPALAAGADTNDADAYIAAGDQFSAGCPTLLDMLLREMGIGVYRFSRCEADRAVAAYRWAARIDPARAEPLLLAWQSAWRASPEASEKVRRRDRRFLASGAAARVDSLRMRAYFLNPFVGEFTSGESSVRSGRAFVARDTSSVEARLYLASAHYSARAWDSTVAQLETAMRLMDRRDSTHLSRRYASKAMLHFGIAHARLAAGDRNGAQDAFRRALGEDFAFYPAHAALAEIAWQNWSDSTTALQEFELALQTGASDGALLYNYGTVLLEMHRTEDALRRFEAAIAASPEYALPHFNAAVAAERLGRPAEAVRHYRDFVRRAPRRMKDTAAKAEARIAVLEQRGG